MGSNDDETRDIDVVHTTLGEMGTMAIPFFFGETSKDEVKKEELRVSLIEKLPTWFEFLNKKLLANGGGDGFIVGSSVSLADIHLANSMNFLKGLDKDGAFPAAYPKLFALAARVHDLPAIKAFNEKHQK